MRPKLRAYKIVLVDKIRGALTSALNVPSAYCDRLKARRRPGRRPTAKMAVRQTERQTEGDTDELTQKRRVG